MGLSKLMGLFVLLSILGVWCCIGCEQAQSPGKAESSANSSSASESNNKAADEKGAGKTFADNDDQEGEPKEKESDEVPPIIGDGGEEAGSTTGPGRGFDFPSLE